MENSTEKDSMVWKEQSEEVITLSTDKELVQKLKKKLEEYKTRLDEAGYILKDEYKAPEEKEHAKEVETDSRYKVAVLQKLFDDGVVDVAAFREEMMEKRNPSQYAFDNAIDVIKIYSDPDSKEELEGGTGLR